MQPEFVPVAVDRPEATMTFRVEAYEENGRIVCGIYDIKGVRKAGPHAFISAVREEVERLSVRLAAVEEQNRKCEERNEQLHQEILQLKVKLHVT